MHLGQCRVKSGMRAPVGVRVKGRGENQALRRGTGALEVGVRVGVRGLVKGQGGAGGRLGCESCDRHDCP